ncbi:hypothetical protein PT279_00755 [Bifidobacterium sp. ESL0784]|uniref:hypothetical protein n=1 Tax=Bifidobacterium sp. ESL0784 TaxID=2983231 RepID=UPI0023F95DA8|nr:hypothetical protein [Bifidobacterium sp. ESL0784]MDF7640129.1 hypothetical protein [Bifidobacterium sp. ESL0784]
MLENKPSDNEQIPNPADALNIVKSQRKRTNLARNQGSYIHFGIWGAAWLIGYSALALGTAPLTDGDTSTSAWSFIIFAIVLVLAFVASCLLNVRNASGIRSENPMFHYFKRMGKMAGWSYPFAFLFSMCGLAIFADKYGTGNTEMSVLYNFVVPLILGLIYWLQGAMYNDRTLSITGVWMMALSWSTILAGIPVGYWVMALLGGGGLLIAFLAALVLAHHRAADTVTDLNQEQDA